MQRKKTGAFCIDVFNKYSVMMIRMFSIIPSVCITESAECINTRMFQARTWLTSAYQMEIRSTVGKELG